MAGLERSLVRLGSRALSCAEVREHRDGGNQQVEEIELHDRALSSF